MRKINFRLMAKNMSFEDKMKLIFADFNLRYDTRGVEKLLKSGEEEALVAEIKKQGRIGEMNRLIDIFNLVRLAIVDVRMALIHLRLAASKVDTCILFLCFQDFNNVDGETSRIFDCSENGIKKPNVVLQRLCVQMIDACKNLERNLYLIGYAERMANMPLASESDLVTLNEARVELNSTAKLEGFRAMLKVYGEFIELGYLSPQSIVDSCFLGLVNGEKNVFDLTDKDKQLAVKDFNEALYS